jgi:hypothetical protein
MQLTEEHKKALGQLYFAKGDVLEAILTERLVGRGVSEADAREAARECSNRIWRNSMESGALATLLIGTIGTPVAGGFAGGSTAVVVGLGTFLTSDACKDVRDLDVQQAVHRLNAGF